MPADKKDATPFTHETDQVPPSSSEDIELTVDDIDTDGANVKGGGVRVNYGGLFETGAGGGVYAGGGG